MDSSSDELTTLLAAAAGSASGFTAAAGEKIATKLPSCCCCCAIILGGFFRLVEAGGLRDLSLERPIGVSPSAAAAAACTSLLELRLPAALVRLWRFGLLLLLLLEFSIVAS